MSLRRTRSCPAQVGSTSPNEAPVFARRAETFTDLRASVRRQTDKLIEQNQRDASSIRAPGTGGEPLMSAAGVRLTTYACTLRSPVDAAAAPELRGDRFGLTASAPQIAGHTFSASFYGDTILFGDSHQASHGLGAAGYVMFRQGEISPGLSVGLLCLGGLTVGFGFAMKVVGRAETRLVDMRQERVMIEQRARRSWGPQANFGVGLSLTGPLPWLGLVGRAARQRGESLQLTRWTTPDHLLHMEDEGQLRQAAVAWGLRDPVLPWPRNIDHGHGAGLPDLAVGDRFTRALDTSGKHGSALAIFGVLSGSHRAWEKRLEFTAERTDNTIWRIALIAEEASAVTYATELPIFANTERTHLRSRAMEQVFEFDTTFPAAQAAAARLWEGELPQGAWQANLEPPEALWLTQLATHDDLPEGVTRVRVAWLQRPHEWLGGASAGLPWYTPRWLRVGREQHWRTSSDGSLGWFAGQVRASHRWQTSVHMQRYHSDERTRTVAANHRQVITADGPQDETTQVTMQWRYGRFGTRAKAQAIDWLNTRLLTDAPLPPFPSGHPATPYTLEISREAPLPVPTIPWGQGETCLAHQLGAPIAFVDLCAHLRTQGDNGMAWLHAEANGAAQDLQITPSHPGLTERLQAAQATQKRNQMTYRDASLHEQALRLHATLKQRDALVKTAHALQTDPIGQRHGGADWQRTIFATERAIAATTSPADATQRLDDRLSKVWHDALV